MANEITCSGSLRYVKGNIDVDLSKGGLQITVAGDDHTFMTQNVGFAAEELLDLGDVTTPGLCFIKNLDATNYVEVRAATGVADLIRLNAGEFCLFRFAADCTTPYVQANTAGVRIQTLLIEA